MTGRQDAEKLCDLAVAAVKVGAIDGGQEVFSADVVPAHPTGELPAALHECFDLGVTGGQPAENLIGNAAADALFDRYPLVMSDGKDIGHIVLVRTIQLGVVSSDDVAR